MQRPPLPRRVYAGVPSRQSRAGTRRLPRKGGGEHGRLYRRLWRWHFYAAFLVIPFVLMQSITGTLYLWHDE